MTLTTCEHCLAPFHAERPNRARYCTDAHRAAANRARYAANREALERFRATASSIIARHAAAAFPEEALAVAREVADLIPARI